MFEYLSTYHYGRCVKTNDWYVNSVGVDRLYYIHSGSVTALLDGVPNELTPGKIYLFPQNLRFELDLKETTRVDHTFFDFFTMPAMCMDHMIEIDQNTTPFIENASKILFELAEVHQTYPTMIRNVYSDTVESYLVNLLFLINQRSKIGLITNPFVNQALDYIHNNFNRDISVDAMARDINLEKNYLIRIFKVYMHQTPYQYIIKYRMNIALTLIKGNSSLSEIAQKVGYSDVTSFSRAFKKIYGLSPTEITESYVSQIR